ncbi:MAG: hypothetical protein LBV29_04975 [Azoarcus sp.]|nr:hypothetical protein [Azoarcus sp.]
MRPATVEEVRPIQMEGKRTATSSAAGSATREAVRESFSIGGFRLPFGSQAASVGSAAVEETVSRQKGIEIMLKLDSGDHLVIAQADKGENFQPGERVKIVGDDKNARVMR